MKEGRWREVREVGGGRSGGAGLGKGVGLVVSNLQFGFSPQIVHLYSLLALY